ncbi:MAG: transcriptional regulator, TrmB [uncultured bacterium]|nr:MAG: transcriptional regulator, TrmB [uncultured bacterium]
MKIEQVLSNLGLSKNKGLIYLTLLQVGTGSAQEIANKANLPRTTVHEILQHLLVLGVVNYSVNGRGRIYTAEPPDKLKYLLKDKEKQLENVLPELFSMFNVGGVKPKTRYYEGIAGVKTVFEDTLTVKNKILCGILSMSDLFKIPGKEFMTDYTVRRINAGIKLKVIRSETNEVEETWPHSVAENRELHYASREMVFPMTMYFYDNKVALIGTEKENFGMIIESADFYKNQMNFFEVMWQVTRVAKKVD